MFITHNFILQSWTCSKKGHPMTKGFSTRIIPINKDNMLFRNVDAFYLKSKKFFRWERNFQ